MTELESLTRRVEQLESRVAIAELVSGYAIACDEHDIERLGTQFAEDAVLDSPSKLLMAHGRAEILAMYVRLFKIRGPGLPLDTRPLSSTSTPPIRTVQPASCSAMPRPAGQ